MAILESRASHWAALLLQGIGFCDGAFGIHPWGWGLGWATLTEVLIRPCRMGAGRWPSKEAEVLGGQKQTVSTPQTPGVLGLQHCGYRRLWKNWLGHWVTEAGLFLLLSTVCRWLSSWTFQNTPPMFFLLASGIFSSQNEFFPTLNLNPHGRSALLQDAFWSPSKIFSEAPALETSWPLI